MFMTAEVMKAGSGQVSRQRQGGGNNPGRDPQTSKYVFDNRGAQAQTRFRELSELYDARTIEYIKRCRIDDGWSCLEVGGGGGSIAYWLCMRVGLTGRVVATDINPGWLQSLSFPNLEVWRHDLGSDPLPSGEFDLVHARLVLMHVLERESALG